MNAHSVITQLAAQERVIVLGGIAVVLHGLHRSTKDVDIWLDPQADVHTWSTSLRTLADAHDLTPSRVSDEFGHFVPIPHDEIATVAASDRFVRLLGADRPIDVFYQPNNLELNEFDDVWNLATPLDDGTRLIDPVNLILSKLDTGRPHDAADIRFLEDKVERDYQQRLPTCSLDEARAMFDRLVTPDLAVFAITHARNGAVRTFARSLLDDMR